MESIVWRTMPELSRPVLLVAFAGWFDVGACATGALAWLRSSSKDVAKIAHIDLEEFIDFQENRPSICKTQDGERVIEWPEVTCHAVTGVEPHDLVLMGGVEPRIRWRTFTEAVVEVAVTMNCQMIVTLGSTAAGVPHTRPPTVKSSAGNPQLAERMGLAAPTYQGPTGIIGTLHTMADRANLPVISVQVGVPHYVSGTPNPKGSRALLEELERVTGVVTQYDGLNPDVTKWEASVHEATSNDPEIMGYITQLERDSDRTAEQNLPNGDHLAEEIQRFLRNQEGVQDFPQGQEEEEAEEEKEAGGSDSAEPAN